MSEGYMISVGTSISYHAEIINSVKESDEYHQLIQWALTFDSRLSEQEEGQRTCCDKLCEQINEWQKKDKDELKKLSAEITTLLAIQPEVPRNTRIYLFASDTDEGHLTAVMNKFVLEKIFGFLHVNVLRVKGMTLSLELNTKGLPELMRIIAKVKSEFMNVQWKLIVSGGYKPLSMLMAFCGMFLKLPVYYAHKESNILQLPTIEWQYDPDIFINIDLRILNKFYTYGKLSEREWKRLKRQHIDSDLSFMKKKEHGQDIILSDFGRVGLAAYLGQQRDILTGLFNKSAFESVAMRICPDTANEHRIKEVRKSGPDYCFIFADIDNFKAFNTEYGHSLADNVIKAIANKFDETNMKFKGSLCARRSGDEFWMVFESDSIEQAGQHLELLRNSIKTIKVENVDKNPSCTFSAVYIPSKVNTPWLECECKMQELHKKMKKNNKGSVEIVCIGNDAGN